ncbi:hypothetical protein ES703_41896 [subsurface metagenome]
MEGHTAGYGTHSVLADAEVHVMTAVVISPVVTLVLQDGLSGWSQVTGAAHQGVDLWGNSVHHPPYSSAGGNRLIFGLE